MTQVTQAPKFVWIGLNDLQRRNYFVWHDNSEVKYTHWGYGQPDENLQSNAPEDRVSAEYCMSLYMPLPVLLTVCARVYLCTCMGVCTCVSVCARASVSVYLFPSVCVCVCARARLSACLSASVSLFLCAYMCRCTEFTYFSVERPRKRRHFVWPFGG